VKVSAICANSPGDRSGTGVPPVTVSFSFYRLAPGCTRARRWCRYAFGFGPAVLSILSFLVVALCANVSARAAEKTIVLVAGRPSHGPGDHEFNAGVQLLHQCLARTPGVRSTFFLNDWPSDAHAFDDAAAILFFMDGGSGHPIIQNDHLKIIGDLMKKGVGLACVHYAVEVPKDKGGPEFLDWIGGYYEDRWSTNPHWDADFISLPNHPITRGVKPFKIRDEWYYNIRFRPEMKGITPILLGKPEDETRQGKSSSPRGPYPHIVAASGREEVLAWAVERADGGRGFGFTGAHFHKNWGNENFRKIVLNALLWTARAEVPPNGVECAVTDEDLRKNLDLKK
jgi:type 1 glutamine amidotransferase